MAVRNVFGHVSPSAARGVALRHDHGSAFLAEHFHNQIRFWGIRRPDQPNAAQA